MNVFILLFVLLVVVVLLLLSRRAASKRRKDKSKSRDRHAVKEYHDLYLYHGRVLRAWLVAYGVGAPALILTRESAWQAFSEYEGALGLACLFLGGVLFQVAITLVNKTVNWMVYNAEDDTDLKDRWWWAYADVLSEQYWLDASADIASIVLFVWATTLLVTRVLF